jgi:hypothetical protein
MFLKFLCVVAGLISLLKLVKSAEKGTTINLLCDGTVVVTFALLSRALF